MRSLEKPGPGAVVLILLALSFLTLLVLAPLVSLIWGGLSEGLLVFLSGMFSPQTLASLRFTLLISLLSLILSAISGLALAWLLARFDFLGRSGLRLLLDLPFVFSPVLVGVLTTLVYGQNGLFGPSLTNFDIQIIFAWPGVFLATFFIVSPLVAREILPVLEKTRREEEEAALVLGAGLFTLLAKVVLPAIRHAAWYGLLIAFLRAAGEFGASNVVSGLIRGPHTPLSIHIDILYNDFAATEAFAASLWFVFFAIIMLPIKRWLELKLQEH